MRIQRAFERAIARATIKALLDAGYKVSVFDGEETTVQGSRNLEEIFAAMFTTDEDYLRVSHLEPKRAGGWVRFIYGNDGWDVINDYTVNLEGVLLPVHELVAKLEAGDFEIRVEGGSECTLSK